ncbi:MAG: tetratricopeptide repeat protein [Bacteroidales bacterium]|nr:tetratricopeptide repeat protein [Bacteroidales bacterium]
MLLLRLTLPVLILAGLLARSQSYPTDSIIASIALMEDNAAKVNALNSLASMYSQDDTDRAIYYVKQALSLANRLQSVESCANTNMLLADLYEKKQNYQPSINYYLISIKHFEKLGNELELARLYNKLGSIYIHNHFDFNHGLSYFNKALNYAVKNDYKREIGQAYSHIGDFFFDQGQYDEALEYHQKANILFQKNNDRLAEAVSLNSIGQIHILRKNFDAARVCINNALVINEKEGQSEELAMNYKNLADIYTSTNQPANALKFLLKSKELLLSANKPNKLIYLYGQLGKHHATFEEYDSAIYIFNQMRIMAMDAHALEGLRDAHLGLSLAHEASGNTRKALEYFKLYTHFKDSIFNISRSEQLGELQTRFGVNIKEKEIELKDNQIALLQREQKLIKFRQLLLLLSLSLLIILSILVYGRLQQRNKRSELLLSQKETLSKAQQALMEAELKTKNSELVNFAIHLIEKNKFLEELRSELRKIRSLNEEERENRLKELSHNVQKNIKLQKDLEEFQKNVDHTHQEFFSKLKQRFPDLTKNEERLCAMLRLNLSSKEIAALSNITVRAIEMGRYRLRKKIGIHSETALSDFLKEI